MTRACTALLWRTPAGRFGMAAGLALVFLSAPVALAQQQPANQRAAAQQQPTAQDQQRHGVFESPEGQSLTPGADKSAAAVKRGAARITTAAGEKIFEFAQYADHIFAQLAPEDQPNRRWLGWALFIGGAVVSLVILAYGWALVQSFLVPFAPFWGLLVGLGLAASLVMNFYQESETWFRILLLAVGVTLGFGVYLLSALRAKPIAAFLVIMSPFVLLAAFLFPVAERLGLVIFLVGFIAGFAAMIEVRPLAIISTSLLGACGLLGAFGLLSHLVTSAGGGWVRGTYVWLVEQPLILAIIVGVLAFVGGNFQFMTGPRGSLED